MRLAAKVPYITFCDKMWQILVENMDREGRTKKESLSISSFSLHFLAAQLQGSSRLRNPTYMHSKSSGDPSNHPDPLGLPLDPWYSVGPPLTPTANFISRPFPGQFGIVMEVMKRSTLQLGILHSINMISSLYQNALFGQNLYRWNQCW